MVLFLLSNMLEFPAWIIKKKKAKLRWPQIRNREFYIFGNRRHTVVKVSPRWLAMV